MRAGPLQHRVAIERPTETASDGGEPVPAWEQVRQTWAEIMPQRGSEGLHGGGLDTQHQYKIRLRYSRDFPILATDRIRELYNQRRTFDIQSVSNVATGFVMTEIMAVEHGAAS